MVQATLERWGRIDVLINNAGVGNEVGLTDFAPGEDPPAHPYQPDGGDRVRPGGAAGDAAPEGGAHHQRVFDRGADRHARLGGVLRREIRGGRF